MKRIYPLAILAFCMSFCSCKKFIQKQEENAVLKIMTTGFWHVSGYKQNYNDSVSAWSIDTVHRTTNILQLKK